MFFDTLQRYVDPQIARPEQSKILFRLLEYPKYYRYFFSSKKLSEGWLPILYENGLLSFRNDINNYYLPSEFLIKCVNSGEADNDIILKIVDMLRSEISCNNITTPLNFRNITLICSSIPPVYAVKTKDVVIWCLESSESKDMILDQIGIFINTLHKGQYYDDIFDVFSKIFVIKSEKDKFFNFREPVFEYENYWLTDLFKKIENILLVSRTTRYFEFLVSQFNTVLEEIYPRKEADLDWDDGSYVTRPAIEDSDQNIGFSDHDTIIVLLRSFIDEVQTDEKRIELVKILLKYKYPIFRRLALYALSEYPTLIKYFQNELMTTENLFNTNLQHEIYRLLELHFSQFDMDRVLSIIRDGQIERHKEIQPDLFERIIEELRVGMLIAINKNSPDSTVAVEIEFRQIKLGYTPSHPDYAVYSYSSTGFDSPITLEDLSVKSWSEIKTYLLEFDETKAPITLESRPEYEGLARVFGIVVKNKMSDFLSNIDSFKDIDLHPSYIGIIPEMLVARDNEYNSSKILACVSYLDWTWDLIIKGDLEISQPKSRYSLKIGFNRLFSHLYGVFNNDENNISDSDIVIIKSLLIKYDPDYQKEDLAIDEPYQGFINRTNGDYLHAWFSLNLRLKRQGTISGFIEEFKEILDTGLAKDKFVHVLLGRFLSNITTINGDWVHANIERIFPLDTNPILWEYTFKGFLWSTYLLDDQLTLLMDSFKKACTLSLNDRQKKAFAERIVSFYVREKTHNNCYGSLIKPMVEEGQFNTDLSNSLLFFFGKVYEENKNGKYIRKYIRYRYDVLKRIKNYDRPKELVRIIGLFKCFPKLTENTFSIFITAMKEWSDEKGNPRVLTDFYNHLKDKEKYNYLIKLLKIEFKQPRRWGIMYEAEYRELFIKLYEQKNPNYQRVLNKIVNNLGEQGYYQFRDLYEKYGGN